MNRDIDAAARDVQAAINAAAGQLPANLPSKPNYRKLNPADSPIMILSLTSDLYDRARMYDVASSVLQQKIAQVEGIGQLSLSAAASLPSVRVDINPITLHKMGLGLSDVRTALGSRERQSTQGAGFRPAPLLVAAARPTNCSKPRSIARSWSPTATARPSGSPISPR